MNSAMAFAFYTAAGKQRLYELHRSSPAVNEIHAKTMEHFMYPYLKLFIGDQEKEYKCSHLMQQLENLPYRCAIDEFEHLMYDRKLTRVQLVNCGQIFRVNICPGTTYLWRKFIREYAGPARHISWKLHFTISSMTLHR